MLHSDFLLAATWQLSLAAADEATRGTTMLCDIHVKTWAAGVSSTEKVFITLGPFSGANKCTYIVKYDKSLGAPAFRLLRTKTTKFQF